MWNFVADVGGTNMRLAAISNVGSIVDQKSYHSKSDLDFPEACACFIREHDGPPEAVVVAAAGVVTDGAVQLTNSAQNFSETELAEVCQTQNVKILNDFEAAAWSLATIGGGDTRVLQGPTDVPHGPRLVIGPGTGLGVGALVWVHGQPHVVPGEGGHVSLSPQSYEEFGYFEQLVRLWPEIRIGNGVAVEAEAILSGTGVPMLYEAVAHARQSIVEPKTSAQVFTLAKRGEDQNANIAIDLFRRALGQIAGDLALVFNAKGGVFLTGGVALSNTWIFDRRFLDAFNAGGRHSNWRSAMPVYLYQNPDFGLLGARNYVSTR
ncbi:ROK family protein [Aliisedimentitalea scapharcae]|uniref:ROK family protein n=1 Tax=Aliisedimentitalea scapharcae TaxID=1524259 RepID=A0ABZ2XXG4_9RHOB